MSEKDDCKRCHGVISVPYGREQPVSGLCWPCAEIRVVELEAELAAKDKRIAELEDDVRMNSHMVAKLNDETVPEKDHENLRSELWRVRDAFKKLGLAIRNFLPRKDHVVCDRECKGCSADGECEDQLLRLCKEKPDGE